VQVKSNIKRQVEKKKKARYKKEKIKRLEEPSERHKGHFWGKNYTVQTASAKAGKITEKRGGGTGMGNYCRNNSEGFVDLLATVKS